MRRASRKNGAPTRRRPLRIGIDDVLAAVRKPDLGELCRFWCGRDPGALGGNEAQLKHMVVERMSDPAHVEERLGGLGRRLGALVEVLVRAPGYQRSCEQLSRARSLSKLNEYDLEACIVALGRRGILLDGDRRRGARRSERVVGLPLELGDCLWERRRSKVRGIFSVLTLRGHLEQHYCGPGAKTRISSQRLRELYKMYAQETAAVARIERLPDGVRGLVEKAVLEFGGILPRPFFERLESDLPHWNGRRWRMILEQSLVGTVQELDLSHYGINLQHETLIVFNETALAWLRRVAVPGDPDRPDEELSLGIDLATNISRFLSYIEEHDVRYTVRGEIFKTTERKILKHLIPNPGRELSRADVLSFIFRFARQAELIDRTGERTLAVSAQGRAWSARDLVQKQRALFEFALADSSLPGEPLHHERMREILVRLLKRIEPGVWYDLMYLPFLARNTHLSALDDAQIEQRLTARSQTGRTPSMEDPQRMAWNLVKWVRERLYLLGVIDIGYDRCARPVALRLTVTGARLLGVEVAPGSAGTARSLVVTPDFALVLFPTGDDGELMHDLDRFCAREKRGSVVQFRITEESVLRALRQGMGLYEILDRLERHSRTPLPQNVAFSIQDWAKRAGLMFLDQKLILRCDEPEVLRRFRSDAGARQYVAQVLDERSLRLVRRFTPKRTRALLRELSYLVDPAEPRP